MKTKFIILALAALAVSACYKDYVGDYSRTACGFANQTDVRSLPLRRNRDAVCRDRSADGAEFPGSSSISKNFLTSRMKSQPQTRKETPNTTQDKKGKKKQEFNSFKLETLA